MLKRHLSARMAIGAVLACLFAVAPAEAQLNTQHVKGTVGLKSGSQPPPGVYFIAPLYYVYRTGEVKDRNGDRLAPDANVDLTSHLYGAGIAAFTVTLVFTCVPIVPPGRPVFLVIAASPLVAVAASPGLRTRRTIDST